MGIASRQDRLRRVQPDDAEFLKALEEVGMPRDDLTASGGVYFALTDARAGPLGYCGYELLGDTLALIRSCVVPPAHRRKGVGRAIVGEIIELLAADGVDELFLFTMDADPFFAGFGFEVMARDAAPGAIRATSQFTMECCDDAILMRRVV
ncbi:MAG: GNAT family N-acetyltransferase [Alphaproteobacteria bacterium]